MGVDWTDDQSQSIDQHGVGRGYCAHQPTCSFAGCIGYDQWAQCHVRFIGPDDRTDGQCVAVCVLGAFGCALATSVLDLGLADRFVSGMFPVDVEDSTDSTAYGQVSGRNVGLY